MELNKIPFSEIDAHPNGYMFDDYGWVNAESENEALEKSKKIDKFLIIITKKNLIIIFSL